MTTINKIDGNFSASPQISPEDLAEIKAAGFNSVICNRPDGEGGPEQPDHASMKAAAAKLGLGFAYQPVVSGQIGEADIAKFKQLMAELPGPILAYCRTGTRSAMLYRATHTGL